MIFGIIRLAIWLAGLLAIVYFVLPFFGYKINLEYFETNRVKCEEAVKACQQTLVKKGLDGAKEQCNLNCLQPALLIKKK